MKVQFVAWLVGGAVALLVLAGIFIVALIIEFLQEEARDDDGGKP